MNTKQLKKQLILNIPYIILGLLATKLGEAWSCWGELPAGQHSGLQYT